MATTLDVLGRVCAPRALLCLPALLWAATLDAAPGSTPLPAGLTAAEWRQIGGSLPHASLAPPVHEARLEGTPGPGPGQQSAWFGFAVAVSGDTLVVGAPREDPDQSLDAGAVHVFIRSGSTWTLQQSLVAADNAQSDEFGTAVAIDGDTVVVGAQGVDTPATSAGAAYVFVRSGTHWTQEQKLTAPDATAFDEFGYRVSVSGDTAVVSAEFADTPGGIHSGAAWVFVRAGTSWSFQQKLVASDATADDFFVNVAISGDTIVVGADSEDTAGGTDAGALYVFVRSGTSWSEQQKLLASDGAAGDFLGWSVGVWGDTIVAGAFRDNGPGGLDVGSAYVFVRSGNAWSEQQRLTAPDAAPNNNLGESVSISGDTIVAGALIGDSPAASNTGAAYVFARSGTTWILEQKITASDAAIGDRFGIVAVDGGTVVVGATMVDTGPTLINAGQAYVFTRSGTTWSEQQILAASTPTGNDQFGTSVSVFGDTAIVGAPNEDTAAGIDAGAAYVFVRSGGTWVEQQKLVPSDAGAGFIFGRSVSLFGDTALIGATRATGLGGTFPGAAYVFVRSGTTWTQQQKLVAADPTSFARFGAAVSLSGDTAVVTSESSTNSIAGAGYVFVRSGATWTQQQKLSPSDGAVDDFFGFSVGIEGNTTFIGSPRDDTTSGGLDAGSAYVFSRRGTAWSETQKLEPADASAGQRFGESLSVSGDTLVVGALGGSIPGAAYVFTRAGTGWNQQQKLQASDGLAGDSFGEAVFISGGRLMVGASDDDNQGGQDAGTAYVFLRSGAVWTEEQKLRSPDAGPFDGFGRSLSQFGDVALVGEPFASTAIAIVAGTVDVFRFVPAAADLGVVLTDSPDPVGGLDALSYLITVDNVGPDTASLVSLTVALPATGTFQGASGAGWSCGQSGGTVTCTRPSLGVGRAPAVTIVVTAPAAGGTITSIATVDHSGSDPVAANDVASESTVVTQAMADLAVTQSDSPDPVRAEAMLSYRLEVTNLGPSTSSGSTLTDTLPAGVTFNTSSPGCTHARGVVTCLLGGLAPSASHVVTVGVTVDPTTLGTIGNAVSITGDDPDPFGANDSVTEPTLVTLRVEGELNQGTRLHADLAALGGAPDQDLYRIRQEPHASYEVVVDAVSGDVGLAQGPALERLGADGMTVIQSSGPSGGGPGRSLRWMNGAETEDGQYVRVRSLSCGSDCGPDDVYRIRAWETTYRIPRLNNSGSQVTVVLLQNTGSEAASGRIAFWSAAGVLLREEPFALAPKASYTLNTATVPALQGASGSITVSHDAPHGVLAGKAVALEPATGFAFDSPLEPRIR
jgi:uncharacterized repeat protein (TIGR01451 family)